MIFSLIVMGVPTAMAADGDTKDITIFFISDLHGAFADINYTTGAVTRGLARVAPVLKARRAAVEAAGGHHLSIDLGDTLDGHGALPFIGNNNFTNPVLKGLNILGFDATIPGNHDFSFGIPNMLDAYNGVPNTPNAGFAGVNLLGNAYVFKGDESEWPPSYLYDDDAIGLLPEQGDFLEGFKPYHVFDVDGVRVAIIGMTSTGAEVWDTHNLYNSKVYMENVTGSTKRAIKEIKDGELADVIVLAAHVSRGDVFERVGSGANSILSDSYIAENVDLFLGAHGHSSTSTIINGVRYGENGAYGATLREAKLTVTLNDGKWSVVNKEQDVSISVTSIATSAPVDNDYMAQIADEVAYVLEEVTKPIGRLINGDMLNKSPLGANDFPVYTGPTKLTEFIHEAQLYYANAEISVAYPFGSDTQHLQGNISKRSLAGVCNYDSDMIYRIEMSGWQVKKMIERVAERYYAAPDVEEDLSIRYTVGRINGGSLDTYGGIKYTIDLTKPVGERVTITAVKRLDGNWHAFDPDTRYIVAANAYRVNNMYMIAVLPLGSANGNSFLTAEELAAPDAPVLLETDCTRGRPITPDILSLLADFVENIKGGVIDALDYEKNWEVIPWWDTALRAKGIELINNGIISGPVAGVAPNFGTALRVDDVVFGSLKQQIQTLKNLYDSNNVDGYTAVTWNAFVAAYNAALLIQPTASREAIDKAYAALKAAYEALVKAPVIVTPTAYVEKLNGNQNRLFITVTEKHPNGTVTKTEWNGLINNNAAGTYQVGKYKVYVDTKGNTQIRECYIVK